jgi:flagella basal body P-ring formation protein FlgA
MADEKNYGVTGEFRVFQKIPVVLRNYGLNEKLDVHDLELRKKEITFSPGYVSKIDDLAGRTLSYPVSQGEPVQIRHKKPENTVEKGQIIQVQYQGNNFVVTSSAVAEQSGSVGDYVKIKNLDSQKTLSGVVLGKGLVEVQ